ncbi:30S ribosomal protein S4 [Candidatus Peregrinibacteria bacterium]|nr:30S ribosomal protein S4 [Candidatus Peregrinibacteria bacterium]
MKYIGPKAKKCRQQGMNLFGSDKYDRILQKKPYAPGKGPRVRSGRKSPYARQLLEKQRIRTLYGVNERQFRCLYADASRAKGQTGELLKQLLERRLDNVIYRAGFALTRLQSRQFVGHGLFKVDGRRVTCASYSVRPGQKIAIRDKTKDSPVFAMIRDAHAKYLPPPWLHVDLAALLIDVISLPEPKDAEQAIDVRQVIEFYSRV